MSAEDKKKLLALITEYGDLKFRTGSAYALGDKTTGQIKEAAATKALKAITEKLK